MMMMDRYKEEKNKEMVTVHDIVSYYLDLVEEGPDSDRTDWQFLRNKVEVELDREFQVPINRVDRWILETVKSEIEIQLMSW